MKLIKKKRSIRKKKKNQARLVEPYKIGLISQTRNPLNCRPGLN